MRMLAVSVLMTAAAFGQKEAPMSAPKPPAMSVVRLDPGLDALIAPGTKVEKVAGNFRFTEGPMWRQHRLWLSDVVGDRIAAVAVDGTTETLVSPAGGYPNPPDGSYLGPNAMATDKDGSVVLAQQGGRKLVRIDAGLQEQPFLSTWEGHKFNSPNDLVFQADGTMWFTDPSYGLAKGDADPAKEIPFNGVFRYKDGKLSAPIRELTLPNGLAFSPDGGTLYVCNSGPAMAVWAYGVNADGSVGAGRQVIAFDKKDGSGVPDGMKVDTAGNLWVTGPGGVRVVTPGGKVLGQIKLPETAANLAWADGGKTLWITAQTGVYRVRVAGTGMMPVFVR